MIPVRWQLIRHILYIALLFLLTSITGSAQPGLPQEPEILHDSRDTLYRFPGGAVPTGTSVHLRLRTPAGEVDAVGVRIYSSASRTTSVLPMSIAATLPDGYDLWEARLDTGDVLTVYYYRFQIIEDGTLYLYEDDTVTVDGAFSEALKGGVGALRTSTTNADFQIAVYDPGAYTPEWMQGAVIYQIFPDRFRDGDSSNNPTDGSDTFYGDVPLYFHETWNAPMLDGRVDLLPNGAGWWNSDFYGGDLAGIIEKLDYLHDLGVTAIYLNPIFAARSNHRYDTADYRTIDPMLGTLDDFHALIEAAQERGMKVILDGVFNHLSSDSVFFDRYGRYPTEGACEGVDSEWRNWFTFVPAEGSQPSPCAGPDGQGIYYVSWANFDSIPQVNNSIFATRAYFVRGPDSIVRTWGAAGIGGWRLDAAEQVDDGADPENGYWEAFRQVARLTDPEAAIIGEYWHDATEWLLGDEWDSVTNYRFRRGIVGFVREDAYRDGDGPIPALNPSAFAATLESIREDTPPMAYHALMNVMDSHDTSRIFFVLDNNPEAMRLAALTQFTLPGAPVIYYGGEIALDAPSLQYGDRLEDDPFNRAPYPWPDEEGDYYPPPDEDMLLFYQTLGQLRRDHPALRQGTFTLLRVDDARGVLAYVRVDAEAGDAVLVVLNQSSTAQMVDLSLDGILPRPLHLEPAFDQAEASSTLLNDTGTVTVTIGARSGNLWRTNRSDSEAFQTQPAPESLAVESGDKTVTLTWDAVENAAGYRVYRSPVMDGGYLPISEVLTETTFVDTTVDNGYIYAYRVASLSAAGLIGEQSDAVIGHPAYNIASIRYTSASLSSQSRTLEYGLTIPVGASIVIDGVTGRSVPARGILAQAGLALVGGEDTQVTYVPMTFVGGVRGGDVYLAELTPQMPGTFMLDVRFSVNGGHTWQSPTLRGEAALITIQPPSDADAPDAPGALTITRAAPGIVALSWGAAEASDLAGYRIFRDGRFLADVGAAVLGYDDTTAMEGGTYAYSVAAVDLSLNVSAMTTTNPVLVERGKIAVTFLVNVPPATNSDVYLAGDLGSAEFPLWNPSGIVLSAVGENQWSVTLQFSEGTSLTYKFVRGGWEAVEKGANCEEIADRTLTINLDVLGEPQPDGTYIVEHTVAKWRDLDGCP